MAKANPAASTFAAHHFIYRTPNPRGWSVREDPAKSIHDENRDETRANAPANSFGEFNSQLLKYVRMAHFRRLRRYAAARFAFWNSRASN
jgi:hypothetical protein